MFIVKVLCVFSDFDTALLSGELIIVTNGFCNSECEDTIRKMELISDKFRVFDVNKDSSARDYMKSIRYDGHKFPVYFYKKHLIFDIAQNPELFSILDY